MSHDYTTLGFLDENGIFDVFANVKNGTSELGGQHIMLFPTRQDVKTIINQLLQRGKIARDGKGGYYTLEEEQS